MKDIELPPLPEPDHFAFIDGGHGIYVEGGPTGEPFYSAEQMRDYSRAAVEADRAQRVPEVWKVEKGFRWDGARQQHIPQLIVEFEPVSFDGPCDAKGWQDRNAVAALLASTPAPAQQEQPQRKLSAVDLAKAAAKEQFRHYHEVMAAAQHQEPPQQERKPMTDEQAVKCIEAAGFKTWTSAHFRLVKEAERHHGIKE